MPYPPGSFTKNFGWNRSPPGLRALYDAIRLGFGTSRTSISRDSFRRSCGIADSSRQLIPVNFFLHNSIITNTNFVSLDELVRHALTHPHSRKFDQLALFSFHFARMGRRLGVAGDARGAGFAREFVISRLWERAGWNSASLTERTVETAFNASIIATGLDTVHKCVTNYLFMLEMCGLREQRTPFINTHLDEWIGPAMFLAFDRFVLDGSVAATPTVSELVHEIEAAEIYKLVGTSKDYTDTVAPVFAREYIELGALNRPLDSLSPATLRPRATAPSRIGWTDDDAEDIASVARRAREIQAQVRCSQHVRELKHLYANTCCFCGKQTIIGVEPEKYYSEAAHIQPLGDPHRGPDSKSNMLILCPEHHLQFDRGVISVKRVRTVLCVVSKIPGDPLHNSPVSLVSPHSLNDQFVEWHSAFWM
jgi:hypothetical protein